MSKETPEKPTKPSGPVMQFVQFRSPISVGGDFASIEYWSIEKHGKQITCEERGNWVVLTYKAQRFRVPMVNVSCIREAIGGE